MTDEFLGFSAMPLVFAQTVGGRALIMLGGPELPWWLIISACERGRHEFAQVYIQVRVTVISCVALQKSLSA